MNLLEKIKFLPDYFTGYGMADPKRNGEYRFLKKYIKNKMTIFDVGANIGEYTEYLIASGEQLEIHTFEPVKETFNELTKRLSGSRISAKIIFNHF